MYFDTGVQDTQSDLVNYRKKTRINKWLSNMCLHEQGSAKIFTGYITLDKDFNN